MTGPDYPMICAAEFSFEGQFDRPKLETAFERTLDRHPMLGANVEYRRRMPLPVDPV